MDRLIWLAIFATVLFVLTYDPKAKTLEKYISPVTQTQTQKGKLCCGATDYRADHPQQCENAYYRGLQFAELDVGCPPKPNLVDGVIAAKGETARKVDS